VMPLENQKPKLSMLATAKGSESAKASESALE
jgi:hypothetical protein